MPRTRANQTIQSTITHNDRANNSIYYYIFVIHVNIARSLHCSINIWWNASLWAAWGFILLTVRSMARHLHNGATSTENGARSIFTATLLWNYIFCSNCLSGSNDDDGREGPHQKMQEESNVLANYCFNWVWVCVSGWIRVNCVLHIITIYTAWFENWYDEYEDAIDDIVGER